MGERSTGEKPISWNSCILHHNEFRETIVLTVERLNKHRSDRTLEQGTCIIEGCNKTVLVLSRGLCNTHYSAYRKTNPIGGRKCEVEGCSSLHYARGYCHNHYETNRRYGTPTPVKQVKLCYCGKPALALGMCKPHYNRHWRTVTRAPIPENPTWTGYQGAHYRVVRSRGLASLYWCADDCGRQAHEWALKHDALEILRGVREDGLTGGYSLDVMDYQPMHSECHRQYDADTGNRNYKTGEFARIGRVFE